jgi:hypothetical protein
VAGLTAIQPRRSRRHGPGVPPGTLLSLNYYSTPAVQRRQAADILAQSLDSAALA